MNKKKRVGRILSLRALNHIKNFDEEYKAMLTNIRDRQNTPNEDRATDVYIQELIKEMEIRNEIAGAEGIAE